MLGEKQRPVRIKLMDGDVVRGWIEYYDRRMVRLTREGAPNLFIFKHEIAYIAEDTVRKPRPDGAPRAKQRQLGNGRANEPLPADAGSDRARSRRALDAVLRAHVTIEYKGDVDLVTEADRASEKLIVERLRARWPEHGIVGRRRHAQRDRRRLSLVRRSAGWHHQLRARLSRVLHFDRAGAEGWTARSRRALRSHAR